MFDELQRKRLVGVLAMLIDRAGGEVRFTQEEIESFDTNGDLFVFQEQSSTDWVCKVIRRENV